MDTTNVLKRLEDAVKAGKSIDIDGETYVHMGVFEALTDVASELCDKVFRLQSAQAATGWELERYHQDQRDNYVGDGGWPRG